MKKMSMVASILLLSSVTAQALVPVDYDGKQMGMVGGQIVGGRIQNKYTPAQKQALTAYFAPEYLKNNKVEFMANVLPYLQLTDNGTVLRWIMRQGTSYAVWPRVRLGIDCDKGFIGFSTGTNKFTCYKAMPKATAKKRTGMYAPMR